MILDTTNNALDKLCHPNHLPKVGIRIRDPFAKSMRARSLSSRLKFTGHNIVSLHSFRDPPPLHIYIYIYIYMYIGCTDPCLESTRLSALPRSGRTFRRAAGQSEGWALSGRPRPRDQNKKKLLGTMCFTYVLLLCETHGLWVWASFIVLKGISTIRGTANRSETEGSGIIHDDHYW